VRDTAERGLWLVHNPRSNAANGVGWAAALAASDRVALGTDGFVSDLCAENDALLAQAAAHGTDAAIAAERLPRGLVLACELADWPPTAADRVEWRTDAPHLAARVVIDGRTVVEGGKLMGGDLATIRADAQAQAARLRTRMEAMA